MNGRAWGGLFPGNRWGLLLIAYVVLVVRLWPFERPISGIPSWGLAVIDGLTTFALPADLLSGAPERRQRAPRGEPLDPGERPKDSGLWRMIQPAALFVSSCAVPARLCLTVSGPSPTDGFRRRW